jgi:hypothetical protein
LESDFPEGFIKREEKKVVDRRIEDIRLGYHDDDVRERKKKQLIHLIKTNPSLWVNPNTVRR